MKYRTILFRKENGLATITLNKPETLNALDRTMLSELQDVVADIGQESDVRVVIVTGGGLCFAAGTDLREIEALGTPDAARHYLKQAQILFHDMEALEQPIIAAINGLTLGGGFELALACDLRIAADNATFGQPEIKIGMIPGAGGTQRLPRLIGMTKAKELLYTGDHISAQEAYRLGLLNKVVPPNAVMEEARSLAMKIANQPYLALKAAKLAVNGGRSMPLSLAVDYEARCLETLFTSVDQKEGVLAYIEKRKPVFKNR